MKKELKKIIDNGVYVITLEGKKYKSIINSKEKAFQVFKRLYKSFPEVQFDNFGEPVDEFGQRVDDHYIELEIRKMELVADDVEYYLEYEGCYTTDDILNELNRNDHYFKGSEVIHSRSI